MGYFYLFILFQISVLFILNQIVDGQDNEGAGYDQWNQPPQGYYGEGQGYGYDSNPPPSHNYYDSYDSSNDGTYYQDGSYNDGYYQDNQYSPPSPTYDNLYNPYPYDYVQYPSPLSEYPNPYVNQYQQYPYSQQVDYDQQYPYPYNGDYGQQQKHPYYLSYDYYREYPYPEPQDGDYYQSYPNPPNGDLYSQYTSPSIPKGDQYGTYESPPQYATEYPQDQEWVSPEQEVKEWVPPEQEVQQYEQLYGYSYGYGQPDVPPPFSPVPEDNQSMFTSIVPGYDQYYDVMQPPGANPYVSYPPPIPYDSYSSIIQVYSFLLSILDLQREINGAQDFSRLAHDSEGYWGQDVIPMWKGNIQYDSTNSDTYSYDTYLAQENSAYSDADLVTVTGSLDFESVCTDHNPFHAVRSCREIAEDGKCWEDELVKDHICDKTCGRNPCPNVCDDLLPSDLVGVYECWELVQDCDNQFMIDNNYCSSTCGRPPCFGK